MILEITWLWKIHLNYFTISEISSKIEYLFALAIITVNKILSWIYKNHYLELKSLELLKWMNTFRISLNNCLVSEIILLYLEKTHLITQNTFSWTKISTLLTKIISVNKYFIALSICCVIKNPLIGKKYLGSR